MEFEKSRLPAAAIIRSFTWTLFIYLDLIEIHTSGVSRENQSRRMEVTMRLCSVRHLVLIHKLPELYGGNYCRVPLRCGATARHAGASIGIDVRVRSGVAVSERLEKCDDLILLRIRQAETAGRHVHILHDFGRRPAGYFFDGACRALSGLNRERVHVARVVEVDELFQALDVAIVEELLLEVGARRFSTLILRRHHGHIARGRYLHLAVYRWCILRPT